MTHLKGRQIFDKEDQFHVRFFVAFSRCARHLGCGLDTGQWQ